MKLTADEVVKLVEDEKVLETYNEDTFKGQTSANGVIEKDGKFYQIEFAQGTDEWGEVMSWDQDAPEVEKKQVVVETWEVKK